MKNFFIVASIVFLGLVFVASNILLSKWIELKDKKDDACVVELYDDHTTMKHNGTSCICRKLRGGCYNYEMDCGRPYDWAIQFLLQLSPMYYRGE